MKIKDIIKWEQLSDRPFSDIRLDNDEDLILLLYVRSELKVTFDSFKNVIAVKPSNYEKDIKDIAEELQYQEQFFKKVEGDKDADQESFSYSDIATFLILNGIDAHFVLNDLELSQIPFLTRGIDKKKKENMEEKRFWTFFQIMPHIDAKKIKGPKDLITFPWEEDNKIDEDFTRQQEKEFDELVKKYNDGKT